jgi:hypothetical protein
MRLFLLTTRLEKELKSISRSCAETTQNRPCSPSYNVGHPSSLVISQKPSYVELGAILIQKKITTNKQNNQQLTEAEFTNLLNVCTTLVESPQTGLNSMKRLAEILIHLIRTVGKLRSDLRRRISE